MAPVSSKEFLDVQATIECRFTMKRMRDIVQISIHNTGQSFDQLG